MSNYQEGGAPFEGTPGAGGAPYDEGYSRGSQGGPSQGGGTAQFQPGGQPQWEAQHNQGQHSQGQHSQGPFQGGNPLSSHGPSRRMNVKSALKSTEFWVLVVGVIAILIAAKQSDGFDAREAWQYITWLSIAYILSRGLTKMAGHEEKRDHRS